MDLTKYKNLFHAKFKENATCFSYSPGRINLIGDHSSYNRGHCISFCIQFGIHILARLNNSKETRVFSEKIDDYAIFNTKDLLVEVKGKKWSQLIQRTIQAYLLTAQISIGNFDAYIFSNIPIGQGFASSSALIVAIYKLCQILNNTNVSNQDTVQDCMLVKGLMKDSMYNQIDFNAMLYGKHLTAIHMNYKLGTAQVNNIPLKGDVGLCFLKVNTNIRQEDDVNQYKLRQEQCLKACQLLGVRNLADFPAKSCKENDFGLIKYKNAFMLSNQHKSYKRALHVIGENFRVLSMKASLNTNEWKWVGSGMWESHECLTKNFEASSEQIDELIRHTKNFSMHQHGLFGAKLVGPGFGGSIMVLLEEKIVEMYIEYITIKYKMSNLNFHKCRASEGAYADLIAEE